MAHENCVVTLAKNAQADPRGHDALSRAAMAQRLAQILGYTFAGEYEHGGRHAGHVYFVPQDTLLYDEALALGIRDEHDLFGGVVPARFVGTKAITHATPHSASAAPPGWSQPLAQALRGVVLPGYTAFSGADARSAGESLLRHGRVRIKPAHALGGSGQQVIADGAELARAVDALDERDTRAHGVALETNIEAPRTLSIGEARVGGIGIAYYGTQREVTNHTGERVYGGSDLRIVRGGIAHLLALDLPASIKLAVEQALSYDTAISAAFPQFFASRRNYDVLQGEDRAGEFVSGVLEQSWRLGGASPAEIAALQAFKNDVSLSLVEASSHETYEPDALLPEDALVHYDGDDARAGRLRKYSRIRAVPNAH
jgi:hypothetical protein